MRKACPIYWKKCKQGQQDLNRAFYYTVGKFGRGLWELLKTWEYIKPEFKRGCEKSTSARLLKKHLDISEDPRSMQRDLGVSHVGNFGFGRVTATLYVPEGNVNWSGIQKQNPDLSEMEEQYHKMEESVFVVLHLLRYEIGDEDNEPKYVTEDENDKPKPEPTQHYHLILRFDAGLD